MKNRNLKFIIFVLTVINIALTSSCKKYLAVESDSTTLPEVVFASAYNTNTAIIGVYNTLGGDDGYGQRLSIFNPLAADDFKASGNYGAGDQRGVSMYGAVSSNSGLSRPFNKLYSGIERANICIKYIPLSNLYTTGTQAQKEEMGRYYGEALTLRAMFYYELIRNWGDVPAPMLPAVDLPSMYYENVNRDETYDKILEDLKLAATLVPWRSGITSYGSFRFTKGAIKGLRARIALASGGFSLRTATHLMEQRADYTKYYQIALDECKEIMANRSEHTLNPIYENVFRSLHTTSRLDNEHELMFEVAAAGGNSSTDSKLGFANGLRFLAGSTYGSSNGGVVAIPTYFYEFDQYGDCRRDVTIAPYTVTASTGKLLLASNGWNDGKFRKSWTAYNSSSTAQNYNINWPVLRFADILLMFAEADNELNPDGPSPEAKSALREVRARAYVGFESRMPAMPTFKRDFFTAIVKERLLEFGDEGIRKYDLIRWNIINSKFEETRLKLRRFMNGEGEYANIPLNVYVKETPFTGTSARAEFASLSLYDINSAGGGPSDVLFKPAPTAPLSTLGYVTIKIRSGVAEEDITGQQRGFATFFEANKKELFPYPFDALNENPKMNQNYGYQR